MAFNTCVTHQSFSILDDGNLVCNAMVMASRCLMKSPKEKLDLYNKLKYQLDEVYSMDDMVLSNYISDKMYRGQTYDRYHSQMTEYVRKSLPLPVLQHFCQSYCTSFCR